jgi:hypothetical protein
MDKSINERFKINPWDVNWDIDNKLPNAGVLIHVWDNYLDNITFKQKHFVRNGNISSSLIFRSQNISNKVKLIPTFQDKGGIIFKPHVTSIVAGSLTDIGNCGAYMKKHTCDKGMIDTLYKNNVNSWYKNDNYTNKMIKSILWDGKNTHHPSTLGKLFKIQNNIFKHEKYNNVLYNEILIDSESFVNVENIIEAVFNNEELHRNLINTYNLDPSKVPFLKFDRTNWESPFSY